MKNYMNKKLKNEKTMNKQELRWEWIGKFMEQYGRKPKVDEIPNELRDNV